MKLQLGPDFIPATRTEALSLLRYFDDDLNLLSEPQLLAIRRLYRIDDRRSIQDLLTTGELTTCDTSHTFTHTHTTEYSCGTSNVTQSSLADGKTDKELLVSQVGGRRE